MTAVERIGERPMSGEETNKLAQLKGAGPPAAALSFGGLAFLLIFDMLIYWPKSIPVASLVAVLGTVILGGFGWSVLRKGAGARSDLSRGLVEIVEGQVEDLSRESRKSCMMLFDSKWEYLDEKTWTQLKAGMRIRVVRGPRSKQILKVEIPFPLGS